MMFLVGLAIGAAPSLGACIVWWITQPSDYPMDEPTRFRSEGLL